MHYLLATLNPYLSPEDQFSLYISNKALQEALNQQYRKDKNQDFIPWLRNYLKEQYERHLEALERERIAKNEEAQKTKQLIKEAIKQIKLEEKQELRQRKMDERKRQKILADERRAKEAYERRIAQQRAYDQYYQPKQNSVLQQLGITDRKSFRVWMVSNHPDRAGENELFSLVFDEAKRQGW